MLKTRINVPEQYAQLAQSWGAKYDGRMKSFYVSESVPISVFLPFIPLSIELVPCSNWENNVRSEMRDDWDNIRKSAYKEAGHSCQICKSEGRLEAHEIWVYDDMSHIQKLVAIIALCHSCHQVKHYGLAIERGEEEGARQHLMKINQWKLEDADRYLKESFTIYQARSKHMWTLDLSLLVP